MAHPQRAEAVAWLSAQRYPQASVLLLLAAHTHLSLLRGKQSAPPTRADTTAKPTSAATTKTTAATRTPRRTLLSALRACCWWLLRIATFFLLVLFACLSKGAALGFAGFLAVVEFLVVTGKAGGGGSGGSGSGGSGGGGDSAGKAHIETNLVGPAWLKVAQLCLVVAAKQGPSLVAAAFVAVRTQDATEKQTTCGFANDYRKLGGWERAAVAVALPVDHLTSRFLHPVENAYETYYPRQTLLSTHPDNAVVLAQAFTGLVATVAAVLVLLSRGKRFVNLLEAETEAETAVGRRRASKQANRPTRSSSSGTGYAEGLSAFWVCWVCVLSPTLGIVGGDHLCYFTADRYSYVAAVTCLPAPLAALFYQAFSAATSTSTSTAKSKAPANKKAPSPSEQQQGKKGLFRPWLLSGSLAALVGCLAVAASCGPVKCFRSDVHHYRRVAGRRKDRAFPHYLLGLSFQRSLEPQPGLAANSTNSTAGSDAKSSKEQEDSVHRDALRAMSFAEKLAPGWLNLAALRADSHTALRQHFEAARNWGTIAQNKPGIKEGIYDYKTAVSLELAAAAGQLPSNMLLATLDKSGTPCVAMALRHFELSAPLRLSAGDLEGAKHAQKRIADCKKTADRLEEHSRDSNKVDGDGAEAGDGDSNPECAGWAAQGECAANPEYMLQSCQKSCRAA